MTFICTTADVDETQSEPVLPAPTEGIRSAILGSYDLGQCIYDIKGPPNKMQGIGLLFGYGSDNPSRRRRKPVNVNKMVSKWVPVVAGLATAHDKDGLDDYESQLDELLTPMLTAPVKQLREFATKLLDALRTDSRVPFLVWRAFEFWIEKRILPAPDEDVIRLKTDLATEIAHMVAPEIKGDLVAALISALAWRSEERLTEIKEAVEAGGKPRARHKVIGRQSCLFLSVSRGRGKKPVEVML